jgi:hypothetical protein
MIQLPTIPLPTRKRAFKQLKARADAVRVHLRYQKDVDLLNLQEYACLLTAMASIAELDRNAEPSDMIVRDPTCEWDEVVRWILELTVPPKPKPEPP